MSKKRNVVLTSLTTIALSASVAVGGTFALFTSESKVNIAVTSGTVSLVANINDLILYSMDVEQKSGTFENGGTAVIAGNTLSLTSVTPGDKATFDVDITNESTIPVKYKLTWNVKGDLADSLEILANNGELTNVGWTELAVGERVDSLAVSVEFPEDAGDEYQAKTADISFLVEAVQANANTAETDEWDGTADTTWYNETDTEFALSSAEQLAGFASLVDSGNTFEGKTVKLQNDLSLFVDGGNGEPISFDPIGDDSPFKGTFDGQGHSISDLYQSGWAFGYKWGVYGSIGLFGNIESATIKNVNIKGAEAFVEGGDIGGIVGSATGTCVFENITITDSAFATYNNGNGGIIGWSGAGNYTFKNITIAQDVVLAGLWGSFDSSIGGVVGQGEPGATYNFENVDIACRIDAYNDCTASYDYYNYRMCGMIIGRLAKTTTIDGVNYPDTSKYNINCTNVTVTYGDWANYHYCRAAGARGVRVEAGYQYGGIAADYDHSVCTVHHMELIPFDQIFGGDQYGVKGLKSYTGVTVVYNNK